MHEHSCIQLLPKMNILLLACIVGFELILMTRELRSTGHC